jgi:glycerol uptake facilitator protein
MMSGIWRQRNLGGVWGECFAEFFGTFVLLLFGDGCVAIALLIGDGLKVSLFNNWMVITWGWGLGVVFGVYVAGTISGAHLNPAVTLAFAVRRGFAWAKVIPYWLAQFLGAFAAAAIIYYEYRGAFMTFEAANHIIRGAMPTGSFQTVLNSNAVLEAKTFYTFPFYFVSIPAAFGDQVLGTALLVGLIFAVVDTLNQPPQANLAPVIIGLVVVAIGLSFGVDAGYAINPARDFGPRLLAFAEGWGSLALPGPGDYVWVPIVGPLVGGVIGALIYDFFVHSALLARGEGPSGIARPETEEGRSLREPPEAAPPEEDETRGRTVREV